MDRIPPKLGGLLVLLAIVMGADERTGGRADGAVGPPVRQSANPPGSPWRKPGDKIDSIRPLRELLTAFRGTDGATERFTGGTESRTALARRFLTALESRDSSVLSELAVTRKEFAWLVFPEHLYARAPYELDPAIFWLQLQARSSSGIKRVLAKLGGRPLRLVGMECTLDTLQSRSQQVLFWSPCRVRYLDGKSVRFQRLFGTIVEHGGRYKFLSYANVH